MTAFFEGIADLFVNYLFRPFDQLRFMENWWGANFLNWAFMIVGAAAMVYWMLQLKNFNDSGEEDKEATAHSFI
ncbi:uracil phosphoribosyltransferase [Flavobacteriaceae bacterium KMM 6897]|nr:uracil phosphoribosyltransferase [Flavobacteriaceae bacterium KMM 6897]